MAETGVYGSRTYVEALPGTVGIHALPEAGSAVQLREIPGTDGWRDATGPYPRMPIRPQADLTADWEGLKAEGIVSVSGVTDVFHCPPPERLQAMCSLLRPYKTHYIADLTREWPNYPTIHRKSLATTRKHCHFTAIALRDHMPDWQRLYDGLVDRHGITGLQRFSPDYMRMMAEHPAFHAIAAFRDEQLAGIYLWLVEGSYAYCHLGASDATGFKVQASYGIYDYAIRWLKDEHGVTRVDLGSGAGTFQASDGLARFKQGFANREAQSYLFGQVLDSDRYQQLVRQTGTADSAFFPAYRSPSSVKAAL